MLSDWMPIEMIMMKQGGMVKMKWEDGIKIVFITGIAIIIITGSVTTRVTEFPRIVSFPRKNKWNDNVEIGMGMVKMIMMIFITKW